MGSLRNSYLVGYNVIQSAGWAMALYQIITALLATRSLSQVYSYAGNTVALFQLISAMEIIHAAVGIVKGSPAAAALQWFGRSNIMFAIVRCVPSVQATPAVGAMLLAWALSEVIRYPWYAASTAGVCPYWLTWLRYSMFIPLYPVGVVGEMHAAYSALPEIAARKIHSVALPNPFNFAFDYGVFIKVLLMLYPFLWWQLFSMLLRQRSKRLGGGGGGNGASGSATGSKKRK